MPLGAILSGASALGGGIINSIAQASQNKKSYAFAREMYERQKTDNLAFWNLQNDYNSPQAQMKRFQAAGLNPNLVYGQGNAGNAGSVSTPDVQSPAFRSPEWGNAVSGAGLGYISALYDLEIKQAQADNLKAQNSVIRQDALLRAAQIRDVTGSAERRFFDLGLESELRQVSADTRREQLRQIQSGISLATRRDLREQIQLSSSLNEAFARVENLVEQRATMRMQRAHTSADIRRIRAETDRIRQSISLMKKEGVVKELDADLAKMNIRPGDPIWYRTLMSAFDAVTNWFTQ